ncbi:hypothetical protein S83_032009 [Arachis hypogaea]
MFNVRSAVGVPSLFSDLSSLYNQPGKADILEQLILVLFFTALFKLRYIKDQIAK